MRNMIIRVILFYLLSFICVVLHQVLTKIFVFSAATCSTMITGQPLPLFVISVGAEHIMYSSDRWGVFFVFVFPQQCVYIRTAKLQEVKTKQ